MASKTIVIGHVHGQLLDVFAKLTKLHAKNAFAFAIIAGNLFADLDTTSEQQSNELQQLLHGSIDIPLPTYFSLGTTPLPPIVVEKLRSSDGELCPNLFLLGRKVSVKTSDGIKMVAIGGAHVSQVSDTVDNYDATYNNQDVQSAQEYKHADILITSDWPAGIQTGSKVIYPGKLPTSEPEISKLCAVLKPRYHFSASQSYFEREPFFHPGPSPYAITRFLSLAPLNNPQKQKAMYAFSLEPSAAMPYQLPEKCTASPLLEASGQTKKRKLESAGAETGFRFSNEHHNDQHDSEQYRHRQSKRSRQHQQAEPQDCFFCLAGQNVGTHMITSIGEDVYMTIAKGPLTTRDNFPGLNHPLHLLIIPLQHAPTFASMAEESRRSTLAEMQRYRKALHTLILVKSTKGDTGEATLGAVTWEISRGGGVHLHWQFLPVPVDLISRGLVEAAFEVEAENLSYPKFAKTTSDITEAEEGDYFKVMIWSESSQKEIVLPFEKGFRFDLQFGRRVLGKLLQLERRTHWKDCIQDHAEEMADATAFQDMFKPYDPAEQGGES